MQKKDVIHSNRHAAIAEELPERRHTEDIYEIITKVPNWILRWGIMLFFGILLMVVAIGNFITYPDTIKGIVRFSSSGIAAPVVSTSPGIISKTFIQQGAIVKAGQVLVSIDGPAGSYNLVAPQDGQIGFLTVVQPGALVKPKQELFLVHPANQQFFGIMELPINSANKIEINQQVLINLKNFPPEDYGQLKGTINYITDEPMQNGLIVIRIALIKTSLKRPITLKDWMTGDAEIITENVSVESRILKSIFKSLK